MIRKYAPGRSASVKRRGNISSSIRTPSRQQGTRGSDTSRTEVLDGVGVDRFVGPTVGLAIRLIVSFEIYATSCNSTDDRGFPNSAFGSTTVVHKLAHPADVD
jgi:hypothetical protein